MTEQAQSEEAVFLSALQLSTPQERAAYIQGACADNEELRNRVLELLASHDQSRGPLDLPPPGLGNVATIDRPITEKLGTQIGPYKLLEEIGEGGMGVVYMAEQKQPIERRVALKIIKPGMDTRQVIARFEAEQQALAMMDHPNIAKVFDAGTTGKRGQVPFVRSTRRAVPAKGTCPRFRRPTVFCDGTGQRHPRHAVL